MPLAQLAKLYERRILESMAMNRPFQSEKAIPRLFKEHPDDVPWCIQYVFSDSIILVSNDGEITSCLKLLLYAWRLLQSFMGPEMPLRGGIAYGELYSNQKLNVFLGEALTAANDLERSQNWIGVAIAPSVTERFFDFFGTLDKDEIPMLNDLFFKYPVPFKSGETQTLRTLNWRFNLVVKKGTRSLFQANNDPKVSEKIYNTLKYAEAVVQTGRLYVKDQSKLPVELRSFWIGDTEPPFKHGDDL